MKTIVWAVVATVGFAMVGPMGHASPLLESAEGKWRGVGWAKRSADSKREAVRCRLTMRYQAVATKLSMAGKCSGGGKAGRVSGALAALGGGVYTGGWSASGVPSSRSMRGKRSGNAIRLNWQVKAKTTGKITKYVTSWQFGKDKLQISTRLKDATSTELVRLEFAK